MTVFVFLLYGRSPAAERELAYALETLRAEIRGADPSPQPSPARGEGAAGRQFDPSTVSQRTTPVAAAPSPLPLRERVRGPLRDEGRSSEASLLANENDWIVLYTDRPAFVGVVTLDVKPLLAATGEYRHGVKPRVLADALRRFGRDCAMLDLDGFVRPGFARDVEKALAEGAAMNQFVRRDPYPFFPDFQTELPHLGPYRLDRDNALMLNSGLVALRAEHLPLIEDAILLMDRLWAAGLQKHDIEQFAVAETLRLGGVKIALIDHTFEHYCPRWSRRYMRRRLRRRAPGARVPFSKSRVRLFKAYWTLRLAMRKARRSWRGLWRKT